MKCSYILGQGNLLEFSSFFPTRKIRKECCTWAGSRDRKLIARDTRVSVKTHNPIAQSYQGWPNNVHDVYFWNSRHSDVGLNLFKCENDNTFLEDEIHHDAPQQH